MYRAVHMRRAVKMMQRMMIGVLIDDDAVAMKILMLRVIDRRGRRAPVDTVGCWKVAPTPAFTMSNLRSTHRV